MIPSLRGRAACSTLSHPQEPGRTLGAGNRRDLRLGRPLRLMNNAPEAAVHGRDHATSDDARDDLENLPLPPGDWGIPLLGHQKEYNESKHAFLKSRIDKYGLVSMAKLFFKDMIIIAGNALLQKVDIDQPQLLNVGNLGNLSDMGGRTAVANNDGEEHKRQRQLIDPAFGKKALGSRIPEIAKLAKEHCEKWSNMDSVSFRKEATDFNISVVAEGAMHLTFPIGGSSLEEFQDQMDILAEGVFSLPLNLPFTPFNKGLKARERLLDILDKEIDRIGDTSDKEGALPAMLSAKDQTGRGLTLQEVKDNVLTILFAGYGPQASTACMAVLIMAQRPEVWRRVRAEQEDIVAKFGPDITPEAVEAMAYTEAMIKEVMRVWPAATGGTRVATETFELGGYKIPKGHYVLTATGTTIQHLDERWPSDTSFDPDRYLTEAGREARPHLAFGLGPHECVGKYLSVLENKILFATLARGYDVIVRDTNPAIDISPYPFPVDGFPVEVRRRGP